MPEGHSVRRLAIQFNDVFAGQRLNVSSPQGRFVAGAALLDAQVLEAAQAHGKQLFLHFSQGRVLHVHLGLYGAWTFGGDSSFRGASSIGAPRKIGEREEHDDAGPLAYAGPPPPVGAVRVRLVGEHGWADLRGASRCDAITEAEASLAREKLGPDPLHTHWPTSGGRSGSDRDEFISRLRARRTAVGQLLMDQSVVAGIGNIYRAELLFRAGLDPYRPGSAVSAEDAGLIWDDAISLLRDGVRDGAIITTEADLLAGGEPWYVYQRQGKPCFRCGTPVSLAEMAARKLYWCPTCQR